MSVVSSMCLRRCRVSACNNFTSSETCCLNCPSSSSMRFFRSALSSSCDLFCSSNLFWFSTNFELVSMIFFALAFSSTIVMIKAITNTTMMATMSKRVPVMAAKLPFLLSKRPKILRRMGSFAQKLSFLLEKVRQQ